MITRSLFIIWLLFFGLVGSAAAELIVIGTAYYDEYKNSGDYKLIYDDELKITWLDYTKWAANWVNQRAWAANLDNALTIKLDPGYKTTWSNTQWRLPAALNQLYKWKCDGTGTAGYNVTSSEVGHLFYKVLGNKGYYDDNCNVLGNTGLVNTGPFDNLVESWYWAGTDYTVDPNDTGRAWIFNTYNGHQVLTYKYRNQLGLGVRPGKVEYVPVVSLPAVNSLLLKQ